MGVRDIGLILRQWEMDARGLHRRLILAPTPRERERWHALWPLGPRLDCGSHGRGSGTGPAHHWPVGLRLRRGRTGGLDVRADRGFPPALGEGQKAELKTAVQEPPAMSGIELANWNWKVVRRFVADWFGVRLCRSSSLNYLHRLGFAFKRPKKTSAQGE